MFVIAEHSLGVNAFRSVLDPVPGLEYAGSATLVDSTPRDAARRREPRLAGAVAASADGDVVCVEGFSLEPTELRELMAGFSSRVHRPPVLVVIRIPGKLRQESLQAVGVHSVVAVDTSMQPIADAVRLVATGYTVGSRVPAGRFTDRDEQGSGGDVGTAVPTISGEVTREGGPSFTEQEARILVYLAKGMSNAEIARMVSLSDTTVKFYVQQMRFRFGLPNRASLVAYACRGNLMGSAEISGTHPASSEPF